MTTRGDRYGARHRKIRAAALPYAYGSPCVRCGELMVEGQLLDLDHLEGGSPDQYRGFAHRTCNRAEGAARGNRQRGKELVMKSTASWLGVDTSNDRTITSVAVARWRRSLLGQEKILTELHRFAGPAPVEQIVKLYGDGGLEVAVDGSGHMRSLSDALRSLGIQVLTLTAQDRAAATACLKDAANAGTVRVPRDEMLRRAVQHAQERDLVGGSTLDKRKSPVDVSPLAAIELAVWAATADKAADYDPLTSVL